MKASHLTKPMRATKIKAMHLTGFVRPFGVGISAMEFPGFICTFPLDECGSRPALLVDRY
jgi:hypothetical protein